MMRWLVHRAEQAMLVPVRVDSNAAVITYRPAEGEERSVPAREATPKGLFEGRPWRIFRSYNGQKHYSGTYWSSTLGDHVIYESRLELANLVVADFDPNVKRIAAQPFLLTAAVEGKPRRHILDYIWGTDEEPVVVDVVRRERLSHSNIQLLCAWTRIVVESIGWTYLVVSEPDPIWIANVRFLAGYRREWLLNQDVLEDIRSNHLRFAGLSLAQTESLCSGYAQHLVRPVLMHMLWCHEFTCDLAEPLRPATVLEVSP